MFNKPTAICSLPATLLAGSDLLLPKQPLDAPISFHQKTHGSNERLIESSLATIDLLHGRLGNYDAKMENGLESSQTARTVGILL